MRKAAELTNKRKAAILLTALGADAAASVITHLSEDQIEILSLELARLERISPETRENVIMEFHSLATAQDFIAEGGVENAQKILEVAFGEERAKNIIQKIVSAMQVVPFEFLKRADPQQLLTFIQDEHPQTIAMVLAYLPMAQAAAVLGKLPQDLRANVAARIAEMEQTPPDVIRRVEQVLEKKVSSLISQDMSKAGGPKALVDLLSKVDRTTERQVLESLSESNPELAEEIKNMMFVFEDCISLDDRAIQAVLKEVDGRELATALKSVKQEVRDKIFTNMSERAVKMLKEDMEFMGPVKLKVVEEAQQKIVAVIRRLEETGEITIDRGSEEDAYV
ncbi:MAG: flagellar motor switch protein FliG [Chthonomonas sp.]|nr:flagellar motor switch protein FliG [Chthonomonas sp.]